MPILIALGGFHVRKLVVNKQTKPFPCQAKLLSCDDRLRYQLMSPSIFIGSAVAATSTWKSAEKKDSL